MKRTIKRTPVAIVLLGIAVVSQLQPKAQAETYTHVSQCSVSSVKHGTSPDVQSSRVMLKRVQSTPAYDLRRPEVPSGSRLSLFGNFYGSEPGMILFNLNGTSTECEIIEWRNRSVTTELPNLGLLKPQNAEIQIVRADGRVAKRVPVLFVSQPDIIVHEESIPTTMPPAPANQSANYVTTVRGGVVLHGNL